MGEVRTREPGGEFRVQVVGEGVSTPGDQSAKVGIAVLVFESTCSAAWAAACAATSLPDPVAGPDLVPPENRCGRRRVMVVCAVARAGLSALPAVLGLGAVAGMAAAGAPFRAAQAVSVDAALPSRWRGRGRARIGAVREAGHLVGPGAAAGVVESTGPTAALPDKAASFAAVAALPLLKVADRSAPAGGRDRVRGTRSALMGAAHLPAVPALVPDGTGGRAVGWLRTGQGLGALAGGVGAEALFPPTAALGGAAAWHRRRPRAARVCPGVPA